MTLKYPELFKPFHIGKLEIKNRITMSPLLAIGWFDEDSIITNEIINYYEERAKGGVGMIFTSGNVPDSGLEKSMITISPFKKPSRFVQQMKKLADRLHRYGTKLFIQIWFGSGRVMFPQLMDGHPVAVSAGPNRWDPNVECRALTTDEVWKLIEATINAAMICKQAGCDGIDINGAYGGYLGDQFTTDAFNRRTDEFGGGINGELKVLTEIISGIKSRCGTVFPVTLRLGSKHYIKAERQGALPDEEYTEFGRDVEQSIKMAKQLEQAGYDAFLMGNGSYDSFYWLYPPMYQKDGLWLEDVARLKKEVNIPVICPGKITQPDLANDAIKTGKIDAVALGRALLADPEWANKARVGEDKAIRPCIGCNVGCVGRIFAGLPMQCAVNPDLFNENNARIEKVENPQKIAVIGGGVAGMECARIAAKRGHKVVLYEKSDKLGGVMIPASVPDFKDADRRLLKWYEKELLDAGVDIKLNSPIDLDSAQEIDADEFVIATGAKASIPPIPGIENGNVMTAIEVFSGKTTGHRVAIIGGGQVGCELAIWLAKQSKEVEIVEMMPEILSGGVEPIFAANRMMLEDLLKFHHIPVHISTKVSSVDPTGINVITNGKNFHISADTIVLATGYKSDSKLYHNLLSSLQKKIWLIGDAQTPANVMYAVKDGAAIGHVL